MILLTLTLRSLWNRRASVLLTVFSVAISVALLLGVEYIRKEARSSFLSTISGTDLVVGARTGPVQLLLYSVFRIGNAFFALAFFRTSRHNFLRSRLDFSLELLTDRIGLSGLFVVGRNPFIDVNIAIRAHSDALGRFEILGDDIDPSPGRDPK